MFTSFFNLFANIFNYDNKNEKIKVDPSLETHNVLALYWNHEFNGTHDIIDSFNKLGITISYQHRACPAIICFVPKKFILLDLRSNTSSSTNYENFKDKLTKFSEEPISQVFIDTSDPNNQQVVLALYNGKKCIDNLIPEVFIVENCLISYVPTEEEKNFGPAKTHEFI